MPSPRADRGRNFRPRRSHEKSRNGCLRCKAQRKKCDELRPSCSRCSSNNYTCCYQKNATRRDISEEHVRLADSPIEDLNSPVHSDSSDFDRFYGLSGGLTVPDLQTSPGSTSSLYADSTYNDLVPRRSIAPSTLDATELSLLSHYLSHTSQAVAFDEDDLYALSVGFPNLAFSSKPVMSSMLALSAACKGYNLLKQSPSLLEQLNTVQSLLALAERHHQTSLEEIQATFVSRDTYDDVLANAALMVLYSSASHSVRIRIVKAAQLVDQNLSDSLLPQGSQWIGLIRAAHTASVGILSGSEDTFVPPNLEMPSDSGGGLPRINAGSPQDGPSESTRRLFLPIVRSSFAKALDVLSEKAQLTAGLVLDRPESDPLLKSELQTCLDALPSLKNVAHSALFGMEDDEPIGSGEFGRASFDGSSKVSPWLGRYMARVTSLTSPRPLRRVVMSFLNVVPLQFLSIIQSALDQTTAGILPSEAQRDATSVVHRLAIDIFSHWLVLVMLLDGVWWIGDIGEWELQQAIQLMRTHYIRAEEGWWPESMYRVKRELTQHI